MNNIIRGDEILWIELAINIIIIAASLAARGDLHDSVPSLPVGLMASNDVRTRNDTSRYCCSQGRRSIGLSEKSSLIFGRVAV